MNKNTEAGVIGRAQLCALSSVIAIVCVISAVPLGAFAEEPLGIVEYVESVTGATYIDTGVTGRSGTKAELVVSFDSVAASDSSVLACANGSTSFFLVHLKRAKLCCVYGTSTNTTSTSLNANTKYTITSEYEAGRQTISVDGEVIYAGTVDGYVDVGDTLYLFADNDSSIPSVARYRSNVKLYSCRIWQDGVLVRDYKPCLNSSYKAALYDSESETVSTGLYQDRSSTASDLRASALSETMPGTPDLYVEYVASDGSQLVDMGVVAKTGVKAAGKVSFTSIPTADTVYLGARTNASSQATSAGVYPVRIYNKNLLSVCGGNSASGGYQYWQSGGGNVTPSANRAFPFEVDLGDRSAMTVSTNGVQVLALAGLADDVDTGNTLTLFGSTYLDKYGRRIAELGRASARCYGLKLYDGGTLARDLKPCLKKIDGAWRAGLYDSVENEILFPMSDFASYGDITELGPSTTLNPTATVEYIETTGGSYIDTGVKANPGVKMSAKFSANWSSNPFFIGARTSSSKTFEMFKAAYSGGRILAYGYGKYWATSFNLVNNTIYEITASFADGSQRIVVNGEAVVNETDVTQTAAATTDLNLWVFGTNNNGALGNPCPAKLYGLKLWVGGTLVRNFIPIVTDIGTAGLWDKVNGVFYFDPRMSDGDTETPCGFSPGAVTGKFPPPVHGLSIIVR